jgi:hypothetical protein
LHAGGTGVCGIIPFVFRRSKIEWLRVLEKDAPDLFQGKHEASEGSFSIAA